MQTNPLLHTWSLAVEEQFYIFFPPLLFLLSKYLRRYTAPILAAILLLSFAYAVQKVGTKPVSAFYMTPARAWELLVGALIAIQPLARVKFAIVREGLAATGLILIAAAVVGFTSATPFPGAWAAVPVGGAALIIAFAPDTLTGRLLSTSPLVFIGKISYSLYLWHWPLFVFSKYLLPDPPSPLIKAGLCALSFGLGYLSWRFVEQPIRQWRSLGPATILAAGGATMAATLAIGLAGVAMNGAPGRFEPEVLRLAKYADDHSPQREACHSDGSRFIAPAASCVYGPRDRAEYALWGDSIGVELAYALGQIAEQKGKGLMYMTTSSCPPSLDLVTENRGCAKQNAAILQYLVASKTIKKVVLVGNYAGYPDRSGTLVGMKRTVEALSRSGKDVVIVLPLPSAPWDVPERLARAQIRGEPPEQVRLSRRDYDKGAGDIVRAFDALRGAKVVTVDPTSVLCGAKDCAVYEPPHALFSDEKHLTVEGARRVAPIVAPYIN
jgi:hypothetical protein